MAGAKGVEISNVDLPSSLNPGDRATARIDARNGSNWISPWDDDRCSGDNVGLLIEGVLVGPNGEEFVGDTVCAEQHDIVISYEATSRVTFTAPETPGTHRYEAYIRTAETGEESSRVSASVNVYANEEDEPTEAPDDGGGVGEWWDGSLPDRDTDTPIDDVFEKVDTLVILVLLFGGMYAAGQLFDVQLGGS